MDFCTQCGEKLVSDAKFCGKCGAALPSKDASARTIEPKGPTAPKKATGSTPGQLVGLVLGGTLVVVVAFSVFADTDELQGGARNDVPAAQNEKKAADGVLADVTAFFKQHPELGSPSNAEALPNWAAGRRVGLTLNGRRHTVYLDGTTVVTVWREGGDAMERVKVWEKKGYSAPSPVDSRRSAAPASASDNVPGYMILDRMKQMNGDLDGSIMIKTFSAKTPAAERERVLRAIMAKEGFVSASLYCSEAARKASGSESFANANPGARSCMLGGVYGGRFVQ